MKRLILILTCALFAASCNPDVFIEPLEIEFSGTEFDLPFYGGSVVIDVSHGDWEVQNVTVNHIDAFWVDEESMRHVDNYISFEITRPLPSRLVLTLDESVDSDPSLIQIFIGNGYESEVVSIMENLSFWLPMVSSRFGASLWISEDGFFYIVQ